MQPKVATISLATAADADGICLSQTPLSGAMTLNGAFGDFSAASIAASQTPGAAGNLTLTSSVVYLQPASVVYITCAGNNSARSFSVVGRDINGAYQSETLAGTNAGVKAGVKIFQSITSVSIDGASTGAVTVGVMRAATLAETRRVLITTTADETAKTFTLTGTNWSGQVISETIAGVNNTTTYSVLDYKTVTSLTISGNAAGAITVGTNGIGGSKWIRNDDFAPSAISAQLSVSGTVNYTLQTTLDDPNDGSVTPANVTWVNSSDTNVVAATTSQQTNFLFAPLYMRVLINSGTGSVKMTVLQSSNGPE